MIELINIFFLFMFKLNCEMLKFVILISVGIFRWSTQRVDGLVDNNLMVRYFFSILSPNSLSLSLSLLNGMAKSTYWQ